MAITISGENNNDRILAADGVIDHLSGINIVGVVTATSFTGNLIGNVTGNVTGNINNSTLLLQTGSTERLRITSGGEILIGTSTDANVKLDVEGSIRAKAAGYVAPTSGTGLEIYYATNTLNDAPSGYLISYDRSSSAYKKINYDASEHKFRTSGTERLRIDSSGRLLVGRTTGNSANLLVQSGAQVFAGANNGNSSCLTLDYNTATGSGRIMGHASSGGSLEFFTNASGAGVTPKLTIDSNGDMALGGSPITSGYTSFTIHESGTANGDHVRFNMTTGSTGNTGSDGFSITVNGATNNIHYIQREAADMAFQNTGGERLRIKSDGKIGIGDFSSINPARAVHIHEASSGAVYATFTNSTTGTAASNGFTLGIDSSEHAIFNNYSNTDIITICNGSERLRIKSDGNIGMGGNTNPTNVLHIKTAVTNTAVATIESTATNSYPFLRLKNDAREYQITCHGSLADAFTIYDGTAGAHRLTITSGGLLGLSNSSPGSQYYNSLVIGDGSASGDKGITIRTQSSNEGVIAFSDSNSGAARYAGKIAYNHGSNAMMFFTLNGDERLRLTSTGKISNSYDVTPSDPQYGQLELLKNGASNVDANWSYLSFHRVAQIAWQQGINTNDFVIATTGGGAKNTLDAEKFRIKASGAVTKPNHPSFRVNRTVGNNYTSTTGEILPWNVVEWDKTNVSGYGYDTSTYKYRVAVAGVYWFHCSVYTDANIDVMFDICKNVTGGFIQRAELRQTGSDDIGNNTIVHCAGLSQCAVGDYIFCYNSGGTAIELIGGNAEGYVDFSGYLIG